MSNINVCQGCYRIMLHKNATMMTVMIDEGPQEIEFCLQCAGNLVIGDLDQRTLIAFSKKCVAFRTFLDPLENNNKVNRCGLCTYFTTGAYCYECNWKLLKQNCDSWILNRISKYADFESMFSEKAHKNESYLMGKII